MNLFAWMILGHMVADWLLQSDWMAVGKRMCWLTLAGMIHYLVYTLTILSTIWFIVSPTLSLATMTLVGLVVFLSHWLIDSSNLIDWWMRTFGQRNQPVVRLMIDQTLHLLILGGIAAAIA